MSAEGSKLRLDEKLRAEDLLYANIFHEGDNKVLRLAALAAVAFHLVVILLRFPDLSQAMVAEEKPEKVIVVRHYVPPPPKVERREIVQRKQITKKVPMPDPTPDEPEPIREPEPEIVEDIPIEIPPDAEILIGEPEAPPAPSGPLLAGVGDVTNPKIIEETKVQPEYPDLARVARVEGSVILQAIIHADGSVGDLQVLRCNRPGMGFEEAAVEAVRKWRYEPATQNGRPVEVYFTVFVEFKLH
jgi:protein TonB